MKPRLYLFLSSLVFVLRIIIFLLKIIPFESLKLLIMTSNKENTCSHYVPSGRKFQEKKKFT